MKLHAAIQNVRFYLRDMEHAGLFADDQLVAVAPPVPPDGGSSAEITISDLRAILERHPNDRWNIEEDGAALLICRGEHAKAADCSFDRYVPEDPGTTEHFAGSKQHWLDEAQRLAALVTALGGNPEPNAEQPDANWLNRPIPEDVQIGGMNYTAGVHFGTIVNLARDYRMEANAAVDLKGERDQFCLEMRCTDKPGVMLKIARELQKRNGELYAARESDRHAAEERAQICRALGCIDKPGVPKEFILKLMERVAKAHAREVELIRSWDPATPTERQELDRFRRGWGPSSPTERNRRHADVLGCLQVLSSAMDDITASDEDADSLPEGASDYLEEAYKRLDKRHTEMLAIVETLNKEPKEWPDIRAAEERGALAMRRILEERVTGLKIIETPMQLAWEIENRAFDGAVFQIRDAPLPRDYHGSARDDVAKILAGEKVTS